jgi:hypothetical protein
VSRFLRSHLGLSCVLAIICLLATACEHTKLPEVRISTPDDGVVASGAYTNRFFAFALPLPTGWSVAKRETVVELQKKGSEIMASDAKSERLLQSAVKRSYSLLMMSEHPVGAAVEANPTINIVAENVSHLPGLKTGKDYLFHVTKLLAGGNLNYEKIGEGTEIEIGGRNFHRVRFAGQAMQTQFHQTYFATIINGYALGIVTTSGSLEDVKTIERLVSRIQFN